MNRLYPHISSRKDFKYPPILPLVYYEGTDTWTAPFDLADRILCGEELLGKYLPHFQYQLVTLHNYSNTDLLAKGDEISLAMLINKIQTPSDVSAFVDLDNGQIDRILKDAPEHLLDILSKVFRALLYSMNLPEDNVEDAVSRIKERKMGRLFENVTMDYQAERRNAAKAREELEAAQQELDTMRQKLDTTQQERDAIQRELEQERELYKHILGMSRRRCSDSEILESLKLHFALSEEQAKAKLKKAFGD